jgi:lipoprotein-anchoring transpeptidase ErfK/SrfK
MGLKMASGTLGFVFMRCILSVVGILLLPLTAVAQQPVWPLKKPSELMVVQDPPKVVPRVLDGATPDNTRLLVSLGRQRAFLLVGDEVAVDTPVSTGKRRAMTPVGDFTIIEKSATHSSNLHGDFVDAEGRTVRTGVSTRIDPAPSGTKFQAVPVQNFMRLTAEGLSLHAGRVPGYRATDQTVRLPADIAPLIFQRVKNGTPVKIEE